MNTTAIPISRQPLPSRLRLMTRLPDFVSLMKPRVMTLTVFTALVGLLIAPARLDPLLGCVAILAIAAGAGAAGVLNMWYDADIDRMMTRTAMRPIPRGEVSRGEALAFGLVLAGGAVAVLGVALNAMAGALLAFTIFFYAAVYTAWLKRAKSLALTKLSTASVARNSSTSRRQAPSIALSFSLQAPRTIGAICATSAVPRRAGAVAALRRRAMNSSARETISIMRS